MPNPAIPRSRVHRLAEACGNESERFQSTATRLIKDQRRLARFFEHNMEAMGSLPAQVGLYMLTVCLRVFEQTGGRMSKVSGHDLDVATAKVQGYTDQLLPADKEFGERARAVADRAQPHLLDEVLWALYDREDKQEGEADLDPEQSAMIYLMLWAAVEALDSRWIAPAGADTDLDAVDEPEEDAPVEAAPET